MPPRSLVSNTYGAAIGIRGTGSDASNRRSTAPKSDTIMAKAPRLPIPRPRVSEIELCAWVAQAEPGTILEYHRGFLPLDRSAFGHLADVPARAALSLLANRAHDLAERGLVHLVQHRHGPEDYSYLVVARARGKGALPDFASHVITEEAA
jgi:hypothetical protein